MLRSNRFPRNASNLHPETVILSKESLHQYAAPAFSLVEMVAVMAILMTLMAAGVSLTSGSGSLSRRTATDMLGAMIEQARTTAITSRSYAVIAIGEPGDLTAGDERCRLGLFKVATWPEHPEDPIKGVLVSRWRVFDTGVVLIGGDVDGLDNPIDQPEITISYSGDKSGTARVHAIVFNSRGGLHYPVGSSPVALRIAEGNYRNGKATPYQHGDAKIVSENRLQIGRVIGRPHRID
jgi:type II secretory pathway pseudopilin PulG